MYVVVGQLYLYGLRPTFKHLSFESMDELKKKGEITQNKAGHILNLTLCIRYSISSNFKNLSRNWGKYIFHCWEKWNFETIVNSGHTAEFVALGKVLIQYPQNHYYFDDCKFFQSLILMFFFKILVLKYRKSSVEALLEKIKSG